MKALDNNKRAEAARNLALQVTCFHRSSTANILGWLETSKVKTFRPKDVEKALPQTDYRTIGAALNSLVKLGFIRKGERIEADLRAREYMVNQAQIKAIATIISNQIS